MPAPKRRRRSGITIRRRPDLRWLAESRPVDWLWAVLILATLVLLAMRGIAAWLVEYPAEWVVPITPWLNRFMFWCVDTVGPSFRAFSAAVGVPMAAVRELLNWLPWSVTLTVLTFVTWAVAGWRLAVFAFFATLYMLVIGYWAESMNSLALVAISVPSAVGIGFGLGSLAFFSRRAERVITPMLDLMQTIPAFAYLLPILLLFGFRPRRGPDCEHPLRLPSHGAEHPPRAVARAGGGDRGRADVRRHPRSASSGGCAPPARCARSCSA